MSSFTGQVPQVRDLARALDISSAQLVELATGLGLRASCPNSVLTAEQADQLESAWRGLVPRP